MYFVRICEKIDRVITALDISTAELVMHGERVTRHCKGVNQALADLKTKFNAMTQEHNELADKFRDDIEALEVVFINATKSAK